MLVLVGYDLFGATKVSTVPFVCLHLFSSCLLGAYSRSPGSPLACTVSGIAVSSPVSMR